MSDYPPPPPPPSDPNNQGSNPYGGPPPPPPGDGGVQWPPPPPPPPPGGFGAPPAGSGAYSPTEAIGYGWNKFKANPGPILIAVLLTLAITFVIQLIMNAFTGALFDTPGMFDTTVDPDVGFASVAFANLTSNFVTQVVSLLLSAALLKGALSYVDGKPVTFGAMFEGWDKLQVLVAALLVSVATLIGLLLCIIPGLIVMFLTAFTTMFVVDQNLPAIEAIKASVTLTRNNIGNVLLFALLAILVFIAGVLACLVGLLVAYPVVLIGAAFTYRVLQGQPVSPTA